jgi:hypothetical protein
MSISQARRILLTGVRNTDTSLSFISSSYVACSVADAFIALLLFIKIGDLITVQARCYEDEIPFLSNESTPFSFLIITSPSQQF